MAKLSTAGKKALNDLLVQVEKDGSLPGFALAITSTDELIYAKAGGRQNYDDPSSPVADVDKSVFWLCSCAKILTTIAVLQLIQQGRLSEADLASKYFPELKDCVVLENAYTDPAPVKKFTKATTEITVAHLLSHTSGLYYGLGPAPPGQEHVMYPVMTTKYHGTQEEKYQQFFALLKGDYPAIPLVFEPGSSFSYGYGTDILGFIVEKITGQTLKEYTDEHIFKPLGVKTSFDLNEETVSNLVDLHYRNKDGTVENYKGRAPLPQRYPEPAGLYFGGGGAFGTMPDLAAILRHLLQIYAGRDVTNALLQKAWVQKLFEPVLPEAGVGMITFLLQLMESPSVANVSYSIGCGVTTAEWSGARSKNSGFWSGWAGSWFFLDPTAGLALTFSSQIVPPLDPVARGIAVKAEEILYANLVNDSL